MEGNVITAQEVTTPHPTPEQVAAAEAILAQAEKVRASDPLPGPNGMPEVATPPQTEDQEEATPETEHGEEPQAGDALPAIDQATVTALREAVEKAVASRFFMSNSKRVATLKSVLTIPVSDDKSFQQFYNHAEKDLESAANKAARQNKTIPAEVTTAMVMAEAQKRYVAKHGKRAIVNEEYEV